MVQLDDVISRLQQVDLALERQFASGQIQVEELAPVGEGGEVEKGKPVPQFWRVSISRLLVISGLVKSRSEANRLLDQRAIELDGTAVLEDRVTLRRGSIMRVGRRTYARFV